MDEAHEQSLMQRVADRDIAAYRELVDAHLPRVARFAERFLGNAAEAEDVAQETFLKLWTAASTYSPSPQAKPSTWLFRIAQNLCIDRWRKRRTETALPEAQGPDRPSGLFARKQTSETVREALAALPDRQRIAITLVHYEGMAADEAAGVLEVSVEALESLLSRARRSLRERLQSLASDANKESP